MIECLTQRIELNCIIPAVRIEMISILEKSGLSDAEISRRLGITKSAVSQYKHHKRGKHIHFSDKIEAEIRKSAKKLIEKKSASADAEISRIIKMLKQSRGICKICHECKK